MAGAAEQTIRYACICENGVKLNLMKIVWRTMVKLERPLNKWTSRRRDIYCGKP